jgi:trk system potassium uptake protein TrkA
LDAIYSDLYRRDHLPIDVVISPELEVAEAALKRLSTPTSFDTESFLDGQAQLLGFRLDESCPVINTPLRQLTDLFSTLRTIVVGVRRQGVLFAPEAGDQLFPGDECYVMCHHQDRLRTTEIFGKSTAKQERIVIIGGGNVGQRVAQALEQDDRRMRIKVIERNRSVAEEAADALERTIVLNGDGLDSTLLTEAGIGRADAVLAITDDDKTNMLAAVRAKSMGCKMAIALINDPTMVSMMGTLGIDAHINPRATTVSSILRHIRHGRVRDVYSIGDAEAEVIEAQVLNTSPIAGQRIRDINFPEGVLIGGVLKNSEMVKPTGGLRIEDGDILAIFALAKDVPELERLLQVSIDFF